jgi:hypothetical protein
MSMEGHKMAKTKAAQIAQIVPDAISFSLAKAIEEQKAAREAKATPEAKKGKREAKAPEANYKVLVPASAFSSPSKKGMCLYVPSGWANTYRYVYLADCPHGVHEGMTDRNGNPAIAWVQMPESKVKAFDVMAIAELLVPEAK